MKVVKIIIILFFIVSCKINTSGDVFNNIIQFKQGYNYPQINLNLSDIADIEFIRLRDSDSAYISQPYFRKNTYVDNHGIVIGNYTALDITAFGIYRFDKEGNFLNKISGFGRGPGEVASLAKMTVASDSSLVLYSRQESKVIKISLSGEYLGAWNLPSGHSEIESLDNFVIVYDELSKLILTNGQIVERGAPLKVYDLVTSKVTDLLTDEYTNGIIHDNRNGYSNSKLISTHSNLIKTQNGVYFSSFRFDTVYYINKNLQVIPKISVIKQKKLDECYTVLPIIDVDDYILLKEVYGSTLATKNRQSNYYIFIKNEDKIYQIDNDYINEQNPESSSLFKNKLFLANFMVSLNHNLLCMYYTYDNREKFYKEIPDSLKLYFNSITENDNPMLAIIKFRNFQKKSKSAE